MAPELDEFATASPPAVFQVEAEMQSAVRRNLAALEEGLHAIDDGFEVTTATGRVDVLARDREGSLVAIELKAGACPPGALEQALGYVGSLSEDRGETVRAILIAASFSDRIRAAARLIPVIQLRRYEVALTFPSDA